MTIQIYYWTKQTLYIRIDLHDAGGATTMALYLYNYVLGLLSMGSPKISTENPVQNGITYFAWNNHSSFNISTNLFHVPFAPLFLWILMFLWSHIWFTQAHHATLQRVTLKLFPFRFLIPLRISISQLVGTTDTKHISQWYASKFSGAFRSWV